MADTTFSPLDFYAIIYDIANSMPPTFVGGYEKKCARLQTAALTKNYESDIKTSNLGKDVRYMGKKIFFSRAWNNAGQDPNGVTWDYPALFYGEGLETTKPQYRSLETVYTFALSDRCQQPRQSALNLGHCESRTFEEVAYGLRTMWQSIHRTLIDYVQARLYMGANLIAQGWYAQAALSELEDSGAITSYYIDNYLSQFIDVEGEARMAWDFHTENTVTYFVNLKVNFEECAPIIPAQPQENVPQPPTYDEETILFAQQAGITDETLLDALDTHIVKGGKEDGWLSLMLAIYPFLGGNSSAHSLNLLAPTGLLVDYNINFVNGWTHNAMGIKGNGIDTYANTGFIPSLHAPITALTIGLGISTAESGAYIDMGCNGNSGGSNNGQLFLAPNLSGLEYRACNSTGNNTGAGLSPVGLHTTTRDGALAVRTYKNGALIATDSQPNTASERNVFIGGRSNNGVANAISSRTYDFAFISAFALSDTVHAQIAARYAAYKADLGR